VSGQRTPGPWDNDGEDELFGTPFIRITADNAARDVCEVSASWTDDSCTAQVIDDTVRANARLIAAAPELLEALVAIADWEKATRLSDAAISKATGAA
jgi:hypothetical protein